MTAKELRDVLKDVPDETVVCVFDMFQPPPNQFFKVAVAEAVDDQSYIDEEFGVKYGTVFMLH